MWQKRSEETKRKNKKIFSNGCFCHKNINVFNEIQTVWTEKKIIQIGIQDNSEKKNSGVEEPL